MSSYTITVPTEKDKEMVDEILYELAERPWVIETPAGMWLVESEIEVDNG